MAGIKISALPVLPSTAGTDVAPFVQGGVTYQGSVAQLVTYFNTNLTYLPLAGGTMSGVINMGSHQINALTDPTLAQDAATKHYVDTTALNGTSVYAASAAGLTVTQAGAGVGATLTNAGAQATFALDSVNPPVGTNVLIKDTLTGGSAANYGIYTVTNAGSGATNWVLTRATGFDTTTEINNTGLILVQNGTTLAGTAWYNSATIVTVDTTLFVFTQFGNIIFPLSAAQGGTGLTSITAYGVMVGEGTSNVTPIVLAAGQILIGTTASNPSGATISSGTGITVTSATGSISVALASAADQTIKGNVSGGAAAPVDLTAAQVLTMLGVTAVGTSVVGQIQATATNDNAAAGKVGEFISSSVASGSAVSLTNDTAANITSISLTAGDWDVYGNVIMTSNTGTSTYMSGWISSTSATAPEVALRMQIGVTTTGSNNGGSVPFYRASLSGTTTIYLSIQVGFTAACKAAGNIYARRAR